MKNIQAIETEYKGYRFRSRLEARWAVFFDEAGICWEYEKEGFEFDDMRYLPDFYLPESNVWVEIKGEMPGGAEMEKLRRFGEMKCVNGTRFRMMVGPIPDLCEAPEITALSAIPCMLFSPSKELTPVAEQLYGIELVDGAYLMGAFIYGIWVPNKPTEVLRTALLKARQARFEHGEKP